MIRKNPFATPESVSTREYPIVNVPSVLQFAITLVNRPMPTAAQSKNMWIASLINKFAQTSYASWQPLKASLRFETEELEALAAYLQRYPRVRHQGAGHFSFTNYGQGSEL
ncbi:unnamed protein product [Tilletia laevis]|nr:hypothetical protein CF335_g8322 [Tilletia laevis]CAD6962803.1 unnamed protein product [Tilletia laevis]CAD7065891.1 unnamed protein product [Tilletia caries]